MTILMVVLIVGAGVSLWYPYWRHTVRRHQEDRVAAIAARLVEMGADPVHVARWYDQTLRCLDARVPLPPLPRVLP